MALKITDGNAAELMQQDRLLVIDFWATWCGPCQRLAPIVEELAEEYDGRAVIGKYNVDEEDELTVTYGIRSIPVLLFIKNGEVVDKIVGYVDKATVKATIEKHL